MLWTRTWTRQLRRASVSHKPFFIPIPIFRSFAVKAPASLTAGEQHIFNILNDKLDPSALVIQDVSGGCGEFYHIQIASKAFKGLPMIKQHRLVQGLLKEEIKNFHGLQLKTSASEEL